MIARAVAQQTPVLFLDEPTAHLDFSNQVMVLATVHRLAEEGLSILMTTHYPNHALYFGTRVVLMHHSGSFMAEGEPATLITEEALRSLYAIDVRVIALPEPIGNASKVVVPVVGSQPQPAGYDPPSGGPGYPKP